MEASAANRFELVYDNEKPLFMISLIFSLIVWAGAIVGTLGIMLVYLGMLFVAFLFIHSAFITRLKGDGVKIAPDQFPDLHRALVESAGKIGMAEVPEAYLVNSNGVFNALATRFLRRNFVVLFSAVIDAFEDREGAARFYIGHELGHIHRGHLKWAPVLAPASFLPLIGPAYMRSREYTCDRYGLRCVDNAEDALHGLAALAAGSKRWKTLNRDQYLGQIKETQGFWMSFHELVASYPWLVKRAGALQALASGEKVVFPTRNPFAWFFALFGGRTFFAIVLAAFIGAEFFVLKNMGSFKDKLGAVGALSGNLAGPTGINGAAGADPADTGIVAPNDSPATPAVSGPGVQKEVAAAIGKVDGAKKAIEAYYAKAAAWPKDNDAAGVAMSSPGYGDAIMLVSVNDGIMDIMFAKGELAGHTLTLASDFVNNQNSWTCSSKTIAADAMPASCRPAPAPTTK